MSTNEIIAMIDLYFDGELEKGKEPIMFTMLSQDLEGREYFKKLNALKSGLTNSVEEFPVILDEKILRTIGKLEGKQTETFIYRKVFNAVTYSFTALLLILTIIFYSRSEDYKIQFSDLTKEVKKQNDKFELIMNALPQVDVSGSYYRTKEIKVQFDDLTREVKKQNDRLELLMNALPQVDVSGSYYRTKQIIVRPKS